MAQQDQKPTAIETATALLAWYRDMGVDAVVADDAIDWSVRMESPPGRAFPWPELPVAPPTSARAPLTQPTAPPRAAQTYQPSQAPPSRPPLPPIQPASPARTFQPAPPDEAVSHARTLADKAPNLEALQSALASFDGCALKATAKNLCFYRGQPKARVMIIGEAPGRDEDLQGKPFVGAAGQLLDRMLKTIELDETNVHITNVVYWRPPGNRTPTPQETAVCRPFLDRQITLVAPDVIVLVGGSAAKEVLGVTEGITRLRGTWRALDVAGKSYRTLSMLHPAYLLRTPIAKRQTWSDLLALEAALKG
jgi:uracil-DNA glycosylase